MLAALGVDTRPAAAPLDFPPASFQPATPLPEEEGASLRAVGPTTAAASETLVPRIEKNVADAGHAVFTETGRAAEIIGKVLEPAAKGAEGIIAEAGKEVFNTVTATAEAVAKKGAQEVADAATAEVREVVARVETTEGVPSTLSAAVASAPAAAVAPTPAAATAAPTSVRAVNPKPRAGIPAKAPGIPRVEVPKAAANPWVPKKS